MMELRNLQTGIRLEVCSTYGLNKLLYGNVPKKKFGKRSWAREGEGEGERYAGRARGSDYLTGPQ